MKLIEDAVGGLLRRDGVPEAVAGNDNEVLGSVHLDRRHVRVGAHVRLVVAVTCDDETRHVKDQPVYGGPNPKFFKGGWTLRP